MEIISHKTDNLGFEKTLFSSIYYEPKIDFNSSIKNWKAEIVALFTDEINKQRKNTKYKPVTKKFIAFLINRHPKLCHSPEECWALFNKCKKSHFGVFFWATKLTKK